METENFGDRSQLWLEQNVPSKILHNKELKFRVYYILTLPYAASNVGHQRSAFEQQTVDERIMETATQLQKAGVKVGIICKVIRQAFVFQEGNDPIPENTQKFLDSVEPE